MDKVDLYEEILCCWNCPNCEDFNEIRSEILGEIVQCNRCGTKYEVGEIS
jgi:hypothetical protein